MDAKTMTMPNGDVINLKDDVAHAKIGTGTLDTESKELIGAVNELKQSLSDQIKVVQKRLPDFTISAGATNSTRANVDDVSGYKPYGIVGYTGSGTSGTALQEMYIASQETAIVYARNVTSASITVTNIVAHILYIKV